MFKNNLCCKIYVIYSVTSDVLAFKKRDVDVIEQQQPVGFGYR